MRRRAFVAVLLCAWLPNACDRMPQPTPIPPEATVVAFGDSVTYGTGAAAGEDWPSRLAALSGWTVVNAGVAGETAEQARDRIDAMLTRYQPTLVIIEIGGNDSLHRRPPPPSKPMCAASTSSVRQGRAQPYWWRCRRSRCSGSCLRKRDATRLPEVGPGRRCAARRKGVVGDLQPTPELCADRIHPNAEGYRRWLRRFMPSFPRCPRGPTKGVPPGPGREGR